MNRQDLTTHLQQSSENFVDILKAAELPLELQNFNPEQVQLIEAITQLVATKQAKTFKEAGELYRKPQREAQLKETVKRHAIAPERIQDILTALKFKVETLTDAQVELFTEVCKQLQSGMELPLAVQTTLDQAKTTKSKKAAPPPPAQATAALAASTNGKNGSAIAAPQTSGAPDWIGLDALPETAVNDLRELANGEFTHKHEDLIAGATDGIYDVMDNLTPEAARQVGVNLAREAITSGMAAAAHTGATRRVIEEVKKRRRPK